MYLPQSLGRVIDVWEFERTWRGPGR
jgi:hypothetical protein